MRRIKIFSAGRLHFLATDSISAVRIAAFSRISSGLVEYVTEADTTFSRGAIRAYANATNNKFFRVIKRIARMRREKPDAVIFVGCEWELLFLPFIPRGAKVILHLNHPAPQFYSAYPFKVRSEFKWWLTLRIFSRRADAIIAVSRYVKSLLSPVDQAKTFVIYGNVDLAPFSALGKDSKEKSRSYLKKKYAMDFEKPVVLFVGWLNRRKRSELFFKVARTMPDVDFVAIGGDVGHYLLAPYLTAPNVRWFSQVERSEIAHFYAAADVFLFPALWEALGLVFIEAMASGLPVVATKGGGGADEIIENNVSGILVERYSDEAEEIAAIRARVNLLLNDRAFSERLAANAKKKIKKIFDENAIAGQWELALKEIVWRRNGMGDAK